MTRGIAGQRMCLFFSFLRYFHGEEAIIVIALSVSLSMMNKTTITYKAKENNTEHP